TSTAFSASSGATTPKTWGRMPVMMRRDSHLDDRMMRAALRESVRAVGRVQPNPPVGCVVARDGRIVSRGSTQPPPGRHAEGVALREAGEAAKGATLYVALEPCNHYGRTPPCTEAIIHAGVARVVFAVKDPNPFAGDGVDAL